MLLEKDIKYLFIDQKDEHYIIKYIANCEIGTYYSETNKIVAQKEVSGQQTINFSEDPQNADQFLSALINYIANGVSKTHDIDTVPGVYKGELLETLANKRFEVLQTQR